MKRVLPALALIATALILLLGGLSMFSLAGFDSEWNTPGVWIAALALIGFSVAEAAVAYMHLVGKFDGCSAEVSA